MSEDQRNPYQAPADPYAQPPQYGQHAQQGYGPQYPPPKPAATTWYMVYCVLMALMYLLVAGAGAMILFGPAEMQRSLTESQNSLEPMVLGAVYAGLGLLFGCLYALGALAPRRPWAWIYGIVLIAFGMTSICCLPLTIPLLIYWIKPDVQRYYGRNV